jgi:hypothetical protein
MLRECTYLGHLQPTDSFAFLSLCISFFAWLLFIGCCLFLPPTCHHSLIDASEIADLSSSFWRQTTIPRAAADTTPSIHTTKRKPCAGSLCGSQPQYQSKNHILRQQSRSNTGNQLQTKRITNPKSKNDTNNGHPLFSRGSRMAELHGIPKQATSLAVWPCILHETQKDPDRG